MSTGDNRRSKRRNRVLAVITGFAVLGVAGVGYAYWTSEATGTGTAKTGTTTKLTVTQDAYTGNALRPGADPVALNGTVANQAADNNGTVQVTAVEVTGITVDTTHMLTGCLAADYSATVDSFTPKTLTEGQSFAFTARLKLNNTALNQDACKGATATVAYKAS